MDLLTFLAIDAALVLLILVARGASRDRAETHAAERSEESVDGDDSAEMVEGGPSDGSHGSGSTGRPRTTATEPASDTTPGGLGGTHDDKGFDVERADVDVEAAGDDAPDGDLGGDSGGGADGGGGDGGGDGGGGGGSDGGD